MRPDTKAKNMARGEARIHTPVDTNGKTPKVLEIKWNNFKRILCYEQILPQIRGKSVYKWILTEHPLNTNGRPQTLKE